jgi:3-dehydroquinate synthetase
MAEASVRMSLADEATRRRIVRTLERAGLPTRTDLPAGEIIKALARDKKVEGGALWLVTVRGIGAVEVLRTPLEELRAVLS